MRIIIQRVLSASVQIDNSLASSILRGMVVLLGIEDTDNKDDIAWLSHKLANIRIFDDENGVMNKSILEVQGEVLIVSQFTLHASTKKGNRPSYIHAAKPEIAIPLYEEFCKNVKNTTKLKVETGTFGANMQVSLINDGPVTIWIDSKNRE